MNGNENLILIMPLQTPNIDDNGNSVSLGIWDSRIYNPNTKVYDVFPVPIPFSINPVKKAIRIEIIPRTLPPANVPDRMPIDENSINAAGALTHDVNETLTPLSVDLIQGLPAVRCDVTIIP